MLHQNQDTLPILLQFLNIYPIRTSLLPFLSEREIVLLSSTCRSLRSLPLAIWDINTHLLPYVSSPSAFRHIMARTNALISGKSALNFLSRSKPYLHENVPLDIYINWKPEHHRSRIKGDHNITEVVVEGGALEMKNYLVEKEGYTYVNEREGLMDEGGVNMEWDCSWSDSRLLWEVKAEDVGELYEPARVCALLRLSKGDKQIRLIVTKYTPLFTILSDFHSSCMMNFISHEKAYSLFPWTTFHLQKNIELRPRARNSRGFNRHWYQTLDEYAVAGWESSLLPDLKEPDDNSPLRYHRSVGDKYTWTLPLSPYESTATEEELQTINDNKIVLRTASFNILPLRELPEHFAPSMDNTLDYYLALSCQVYTHKKLNMQYIVDGLDPRDQSSVECWINMVVWTSLLR